MTMKVSQLLCSGTFAGTESVACSLAKAIEPLVDRSVLYLVLELRGGKENCERLKSKVEEYGLDFRVFKTDRRLSNRLFNELKSAFEEDNIDIAHSHSAKAVFYSSLIKFFHRRYPKGIVYTSHGFDLTSLMGKIYVYSSSVLSVYLSNQVVTVSKAISRHYKHYPLLTHKINTLPNAILDKPKVTLHAIQSHRLGARKQISKRYTINEDLPWVACIGRIMPIKNHRLMIEATAQILNEGTKAHFFIIGDGPLRNEMENLVDKYNLKGNVTFTGHLDSITEFYQAIDLLMLTSDSEGSPMVVLEAMSHGLPILATAVGGVPDLVFDENNGLLIPPKDLKQCVESLKRLIKNEHLRKHLGLSGYHKALSAFNPVSWAEKHVALYSSTLASNKK